MSHVELIVTMGCALHRELVAKWTGAELSPGIVALAAEMFANIDQAS